MVMGGWELEKDEEMHKTFVNVSSCKFNPDQDIAWFSFCDKRWLVNTLAFFFLSSLPFLCCPETLMGPAGVWCFSSLHFKSYF